MHINTPLSLPPSITEEAEMRKNKAFCIEEYEQKGTSSIDGALEVVEFGEESLGDAADGVCKEALCFEDLVAPLCAVEGEGVGEAVEGDDGAARARGAGGDVDGVGGGDEAERGGDGGAGALDALEDPLEDAGVVGVAGPEVAAAGVLAEPVDGEDAREARAALGRAARDVEPVLEVVAHVVPAEGRHREGVVAEAALLARGRAVRADHRAREHAALPRGRLNDERHDARAPPPKEDRADRHAPRAVPRGVQARAVHDGGRETCIPVGRKHPWLPKFSSPCYCSRRWLLCSCSSCCCC